MSDAYLNYVTLIAHCEGAHESTVTFDSCVNTSITGTAPLSNLQKKFGTTSLYFDGTKNRSLDKLSLLSFSSRDFCVEAFVRLDAVPIQGASSSPTAFRPIISACSNVDNIFLLAVANITGVTSGSALYFRALDTALGCEVVGNFAFQGGVWYHVAVSKSANRVTLFVDGAVIGTGTMNYPVYSSTGVTRYIGAYAYTGFTSNFYGYIDEIRITDGVPRYEYNTSFTPPTGTFDGPVIRNADDIPRANPAYDWLDLPFEKVGSSTNLFVSGKPFQYHQQASAPVATVDSDVALFKNGSYKCALTYSPSGQDAVVSTKRRDGTSPTESSATVEFVIEFFIKVTGFNDGYLYCILKSNTSVTSAMDNQPFNILFKDKKIGIGSWPNSSSIGTAVWSEATLGGGWNHVCMERVAGVGTFMYVNGIPTAVTIASRIDAASNTYTYLNYIYYTDNSQTMGRVLGCRLSELRWTVGASRYGGARFNPPTKGLPTGAGDFDPYWGSVMLLSPYDGYNITAASADYKNQAFTSVGTVTSVVSSTEVGVVDLYTPYTKVLKLAAGARLTYTGSNLYMGESDWTVEAHLNLRTSAAGGVFAFPNSSGDGSYLCGLHLDASGKLNLWLKNTANVVGPTLPTAQFMHVAISKVGISLFMHCDGVFYGPISASELASVGVATGSFTVGSSAYTSAPAGVSSAILISQLRITRGLSRYPQSNVAVATVRQKRYPTTSGEVIAGTVLDSESTPVARKVRVHRDSTGELMNEVTSDPATGAFSVQAAYSEPHYIVAFDPSGNAQIFDRVLPVPTV